MCGQLAGRKRGSMMTRPVNELRGNSGGPAVYRSDNDAEKERRPSKSGSSPLRVRARGRRNHNAEIIAGIACSCPRQRRAVRSDMRECRRKSLHTQYPKFETSHASNGSFLIFRSCLSEITANAVSCFASADASDLTKEVAPVSLARPLATFASGFSARHFLARRRRGLRVVGRVVVIHHTLNSRCRLRVNVKRRMIHELMVPRTVAKDRQSCVFSAVDPRDL